MAQVTAISSVTVEATPQVVLGALGDYTTVRPRILSEHYSDYRVVEGGIGDGTVVGWKLQATKSRSRDFLVSVTQSGSELVERDANSTMVIDWNVAPAGSGSTVSVTSTWKGAGGIGGFFERTFAPAGLRKIQDEVLANLARELQHR
ncbi:MAG: SRPBCC family protein [Mycobacteriaceae bacterium]